MRKIFLTGLGVLVLGAGAFAIAAPHALAPYIAPPQEPKGISILFGGDVMLDRNVAKRSEDRGGAGMWSPALLQYFEDPTTDLRVVNLEGTITTNQSIARRDSSILRFTFNPEFAHSSLAPLRLSAVSLANNHALDFYQSGYQSTKHYLDEWGIPYFGHPLNSEGMLSAQLLVDGKTICLVGYHELFESDPTSVLAEIERLRPSCFRTVVMPHWGIEYEGEPYSKQVSLAHQFLDAGADAVVGAHPHVVQTIEIYDGKPILYSLGNFMFDQDFSWETTHGVMAKLEFLNTETRVSFIPASVVLSEGDVATGEAKGRILEALIGSGLPLEVAEGIRAKGSFTLPRKP